MEKELNDGIACVERYTQALQREILAREALLALLATANQYYATQKGEVKVVAYVSTNYTTCYFNMIIHKSLQSVADEALLEVPATVNQYLTL